MMGQVLKSPWTQLGQHLRKLERTLQPVVLLLIVKNVTGNQPK